MVRLLHVQERCCPCCVDGFNPTMVRLLRSTRSCSHADICVSIPQWCDCCSARWSDDSGTLTFQSHNGAIAARCDIGDDHSWLWFQSHNGAIAARILLGHRSAKQNRFNPTMVRLLPSVSSLKRITIVLSFNPTMVRLLPRQNFGV